nr:rhodanese-like domain-containing protein [Anaerolineae bacterium]
YDQPFYLIAAENALPGLVRNLISIGLDNIDGVFDPEVVTRQTQLQHYDSASLDQIADKVVNGEVVVLDVRGTSEWNEGHIPGARHIMLGYLPERLSELPTDKPVVVHCRTNNRSAIGASLLQAKGFKNVIKLTEGYQGWAKAHLPIERNGGAN